MSNLNETKKKFANEIVALIQKVEETFKNDCDNIGGKASEGTKSKDKIKKLRIDLKNEVRNNPSLKDTFLNEIAEIKKIIVNREYYNLKLNKIKTNSELKSRYENNKVKYTDGRCNFRKWVWKAIDSICETSVVGQYSEEEINYINEQLDIIKDLLKHKDMIMEQKSNNPHISKYFKVPAER